MDQIQQLFNNSMPIFANCKSLACYHWDKRNEIKANARPTPFRPIWSNFNGSTTHINDDANGLAFYIHNQYGMLRPTDLFHIFLFSSLFSRFEINAIEIHKPFSSLLSLLATNENICFCSLLSMGMIQWLMLRIFDERRGENRYEKFAFESQTIQQNILYSGPI